MLVGEGAMGAERGVEGGDLLRGFEADIAAGWGGGFVMATAAGWLEVGVRRRRAAG